MRVSNNPNAVTNTLNRLDRQLKKVADKLDTHPNQGQTKKAARLIAQAGALGIKPTAPATPPQTAPEVPVEPSGSVTEPTTGTATGIDVTA